MSELNENNQNSNQNTNQNNGGSCCDPYPDYNPQSDYNNGQYYDPQAGYNSEQYYDPQAGYNNGQYYDSQVGYNSGQYYNPQSGYNNGQYYGSQAGYNSGQYYGPQAGYNNGQYYNPTPYQNPQVAYQQAQPAQQPVSNVFYYILMALTAIFALLTMAATVSLIRTAIDEAQLAALQNGQNYTSLYNHLMTVFTSSPAFPVYSLLNYAFRMAIFAVSIVDIVLVRKKGYPILGMVLFTIFFKPGYFLWRAYAAKQPKLLPVLFTVFYVLLHVGFCFWCFSYVMRLMI